MPDTRTWNGSETLTFDGAGRLVGYTRCCQCRRPTKSYAICLDCGDVKLDGTEPSLSLSQIEAIEYELAPERNTVMTRARLQEAGVYDALRAMRAELNKENDGAA